MKRKKSLIVILALGCLIAYTFLIIRLSSNDNLGVAKTNDPELARFIENYNMLKENWLYFDSEENVINAATKAMTNSNIENDRYTEYIPSNKSQEYFESFDSNYIGLGIKFLMTRDYPLVSEVFKNSPAEKAGIKTGDYLTSVNGKSLKGLKLEKVRELVVGKSGEKRDITILRNNQKINMVITLADIDSSVNYEIIENIGYLQLNEFTKTSAKEVKKALAYFDKEKVKKVIVDLRDNPGGYLDALEDIADIFVEKNKTIIKTKDNKGNIQEYKTKSSGKYDKEIVILANGNSASASEALIACLSENNKAQILGETTFGKGIMQGFYEYGDGAYLKYTTAEWLTPNNNAINGKGIKPTKEIKKSEIFKAAELLYNFDKDIKYDSVNKDLISYQKALKALGYDVDRIDGYYSSKTRKAIEKFKLDFQINEKDLGKLTQAKIVEEVLKAKASRNNDNVLNQALK